MKRRPLRFAGPGLLVSILVLTWGSVAGAHAAYKDSNPADESRVTQAPSEIWAEYTEPPSQGSYLRVFDPCGDQVDNGDSRPEGYRVYVTLTAARSGTYRVEWFVDSSLDNHPTRGTFTFTATDGEPCPGDEPVDEEDESGRSSRDRSINRSGPGETDGDGSDGSVGAVEQGDRDGSGRNRREGKPRAEERRGTGDRDRGGVVAADTGSPDDPLAPEEPGLLSDIPLGGVVIALVMTVVIGAAGGFIYAGIMGYHRVSN